MLYLRHISLVQFKNYLSRSFQFQEKILGIHGKNGVGKTNLLDAIHYLCFTRSYFTRQDAANNYHGKSGFRIEGAVTLQDKEETAVCILRENGRKEFTINERPYDKFSQHLGRYPCVIIVPDDAQLITGGSEERRKFLDSLLSQLDKEYLAQLINYTRILQQRNSLLRSFAESGQQDLSLLEVLDQQLAEPGDWIYKKRSEFLVSFLPLAKRMYQDISRQADDITIYYESELGQASMQELLQLNRNKDLYLQRTVSGIHRDDLEFEMRSQLFRNIASQGQRKSLLFALKLAELEILKQEKGFAPILLLDDVFEKLDEDRIQNLLHKVGVENDGQVFITDTNEQRLRQHLEQLNKPFELIGL